MRSILRHDGDIISDVLFIAGNTVVTGAGQGAIAAWNAASGLRIFAIANSIEVPGLLAGLPEAGLWCFVRALGGGRRQIDMHAGHSSTPWTTLPVAPACSAIAMLTPELVAVSCESGSVEIVHVSGSRRALTLRTTMACLAATRPSGADATALTALMQDAHSDTARPGPLAPPVRMRCRVHAFTLRQAPAPGPSSSIVRRSTAPPAMASPAGGIISVRRKDCSNILAQGIPCRPALA